MASYDRRILVPYLQDVCTTELLCVKLTREIDECQKRIANLNGQINRKVTDPVKPRLADCEDNGSASDSGGIAMIIWIFIFVGAGAWLWKWTPLGASVPIAIALIMLCGWISESNAQRKSAQKKYDTEMYWYEKKIQDNEAWRNNLPQYRIALQRERQYLDVLNQHLIEARSLRNDVYGVNIIPSKYRTVHVAYYLHDYFSTCRENDLDKIIQTMLLDEIVQRLDIIIMQNEEIILNQRIQLAMQEQQNRSLAEHQRKELQTLARMERNQELQMDYQHMIAKNQAVTNFLLAADYLRKTR